jgi:hypothetical protein
VDVLKTFGYRQSEDVILSVAGSPSSFTLTVTATGGSADSYSFDSAVGGSGEPQPR